MNDLETLLPEALERARSEGMRPLPPGAKAEVMGRIRRRRMVRMTSALSAAAVLIAGGIWGLRALEDVPRDVAKPTAAHEPLPEPPESLAAEVPPSVRHLIVPGLVLLYRDDDGDYHATVEGVGNGVAIECPQPLKPSACPQVSAAIWVVREDGSSDSDGGNFFDVPEVPKGAEVLWSSPPPEGAIGIDSMGACDRIERFVPLYACEDGRPVQADAESLQLSGAGRATVPSEWNISDIEMLDERTDLLLAASTSDQPWLDIESGLAPTDGFVLVKRLSTGFAGGGLPESSMERLPTHFTYDDLRAASGNGIHDVPVRSLVGWPPLRPGVGCTDCSVYEVAAWIGPEASRTTWAQARFIVESLELSDR